MTSSTVVQPSTSATSAPQEEFRDLGFGTEVARGTRRRLLNRDGSFNVVRDALDPLSSLSLYHWLLTISWPRFLAFISGSYIIVNIFFAVAFLLLGPDALQSSTGDFAGSPFYRAFFFSVDTFATIGYGNIIPVGAAANTLVTIEALLNIVGVALATGVIFARFSRPSARIIYSRNAIVAPYREKTALEFRIANARSSQLIEVQVQAILTKLEQVGDSTVRKFYDLSLERNRVVFFPLSWTVVHPIDPASPMWGLTHADLLKAEAELLVLLIGTDETVSQSVHSRSSYQASEIVWGAKFSNMFMRTEAEGIIGMNLSRIHEIERVRSV
ncbi:MAG: transporter [Gemmatimonadetes bacterium]|nr:MAG: transporter [Gemmatimonadota bacterium]PYP53107.1 MAG: transporter [Gemmatimonadota bacterium]